MKVALVHELLTMKGGAERVCKIFADMFPDAPIYTLLYNENKLSDWFPKERIHESNVRRNILQKNFQFSIFNFQFNHHLYLSKFPHAIESFDFHEYDLLISSSSAFAHGIITNGNPKHICYVHSPARYLWDRTHDVLDRASQGVLGPLKRWYLERTFHKLRIWDSEAADRPDVLLAASKEVQRRIELYWRRDSEVVHPPIDDVWLESESQRVRESESSSFFLIVSTLTPYKRIDLAIEAFNALGLSLKIAGTGHDEKRLKAMANGNIEFLGHQDGVQLKELYRNATAVVFPGDEDFGLVPLEAMSQGTPVIAYKSGGALETIDEGKTGTFFTEQNADSLQQVIEKFDQNLYSKDTCTEKASQHSRQKFEQQIQMKINEIL